MRKVMFTLLAVMMMVGLFSGVAMAIPDPDNFGGEGEGFDQTGSNHFTHKDGDVRFNWREGDPAFVVPGNGGEMSNEDSAAYLHSTGETIVRPLR